MPEESVEQIFASLRYEVNEAIATMTWAQFGLQKVVESIKADPVDNPENPDPRLIMGKGKPNSPDARILAEWRRSETIAKLSPGGDGFVRLGQNWVVSIYQTWEDDIRARVAKAAGVPKLAVGSPVFGDLRHVRHDIIHRRGVATAEHSGKATLLGWFEEGDQIVISTDHLLDFLEKLDAHPVAISSS